MGFDSWRRQRIFLSLAMFRPASSPMSTGGYFLGGKAAECETDHFPPSSAEFKNYRAAHLSPISKILSWESDKTTNKTNSVALVWELNRPSDRRLSAKLVRTFADRACNVVCVTDPYGRILEFLDRRRYFFFKVTPQLYSRS
jgi:hypothetical protein